MKTHIKTIIYAICVYIALMMIPRISHALTCQQVYVCVQTGIQASGYGYCQYAVAGANFDNTTGQIISGAVNNAWQNYTAATYDIWKQSTTGTWTKIGSGTIWMQGLQQHIGGSVNSFTPDNTVCQKPPLAPCPTDPAKPGKYWPMAVGTPVDWGPNGTSCLIPECMSNESAGALDPINGVGAHNCMKKTCPPDQILQADGTCKGRCPVTAVWDVQAEICVDKCPNNEERVDGVCMADCPTGTTRYKDQCLPDCKSTQERDMWGECQDPCGENKHKDATGNCVDDCPAGQEKINGVCVNKCPDGQQRDTDGTCKVKCPDGQEYINGVCVAKCPDGQQRNGGVCEQKCPDGQEKIGDNCVAKCPDGQQRDATTGKCITQTCATGYVLVDGKCQAETYPSNNTTKTDGTGIAGSTGGGTATGGSSANGSPNGSAGGGGSTGSNYGKDDGTVDYSGLACPAGQVCLGDGVCQSGESEYSSDCAGKDYIQKRWERTKAKFIASSAGKIASLGSYSDMTGTSTFTFNFGNLGGVQQFDFAQYSLFFVGMRVFVMISAALIAIKIIFLKQWS